MPSSDTSSEFELDPVDEASSSLLTSPDAPLTSATPTLPKWYRPPRWLTTDDASPFFSLSSISSLSPRTWWSTTRWSQHRVPRAAARALRPRLTWRYVLLSLLLLYVLVRAVVLRRPLLASRLPAYTGPHAVGAVDVEVPLADGPRLLSNATFKATGRPAFELQSVLFTLYYPVAAGDASSSSSSSSSSSASRNDQTTSPLYWIPKPVSLTARGYARFAHVDNFLVRPVFTFFLWLLAGGITVPARVDAPLLPVDDAAAAAATDAVSLLGKNGRLPVVLFSHGDASSRTDYTNYLGELASRGVVVAALEHRDGSCPGTLVRLPGEPDREVLTFRASELVAPVGDVDDSDGDEEGGGGGGGGGNLKRGRHRSSRSLDEGKLQPVDSKRFLFDQLEFRNAEMFQALHVLQALHAGNGSSLASLNTRRGHGGGGTVAFPSFASRLDLSQLVIAGHSHGATLALKSLVDSPLPARGGIALDPGKSSGDLDARSRAPLLVVHSDSWSRARTVFFPDRRPHFDVVKDLVRAVLRRAGAAWFVTSLGTSHPSVSDAPLIEPWILSWTTGARMNTKEALEEYVRISVDFMYFLRTGRARALLAEPVTHHEYDEWVSDDRKQEFPKAMARLWEVHVSPAIDKS
ncbi:1-alkyl-2-acetylglycerophosphocholine esterase [Purpureocillium takamizusanense]|uniref:Putative phospholipase n=1 Tax=Purpureocillium takamizusanense TaxID=2060973 RepID=A0A9Q8Q6D5_9HYPO|nr:1-alkyl-2-acetylglycerophosphocholine esterase [Purpureocillium takamizusanense]UNI13602.1 1-alkyl-2-acetylglycerophosphocholine esterase [Purpureocillium takamizusanense]